jgi:hypothetical protein
MPHIDNASPHGAGESIKCMRKSRIHSIDHLPYSPDLAPSDFCPFGKLKGALFEHELDSKEPFLLAIQEITDSIA